MLGNFQCQCHRFYYTETMLCLKYARRFPLLFFFFFCPVCAMFTLNLPLFERRLDMTEILLTEADVLLRSNSKSGEL